MVNPNVIVKNIVTNPTLYALINVIARACLIYIFLVSGIGKLNGYQITAEHMEQLGIPSLLLPPTILLEVGGGLAVLLGFQTRILALFLGLFTLASGFLVHGAPGQEIQLMKNFGITGGFLAIMLLGGGAWSIDRFLERK
ncbi:DoxX family protein [Otariodibacter sp.]|uniref:DoxX family protein n=1 Tax=Otariodibacter sp. TaxID=3030919 RepID=UPI00262D58EF|nr:DoxX family protein [Otariodibacter sp.]